MEKAGDILKHLLDTKQRQNAAHYSSLFQGWAVLVGAPLDRHSWVRDIVNHILMVEVDHPGWIQMLFFQKRKVLSRLQRTYPELEIRDMSIRLGDPRTSGGEATAAAAGVAEEGTEEVDVAIEEVVARVEENELKEGLKKLFISAVKRAQKADRSGEEGGGG